jgi:hypothetical protein
MKWVLSDTKAMGGAVRLVGSEWINWRSQKWMVPIIWG